jgi:hypothetical protein
MHISFFGVEILDACGKMGVDGEGVVADVA